MATNKNRNDVPHAGGGDLPVPDLHTMEVLCRPTLNGQGGPISPIAIQATNFRLKNDMIQKVQNSCQFHRLLGDDANKHLDKFLHVTQSIKVNGVTDDTLHLYLFSHSLTHHATAWFDRLLKNSITTFEQMAKMFLRKYFPPSMPPLAKVRTYMLRKRIFKVLILTNLKETVVCLTIIRTIISDHKGLIRIKTEAIKIKTTKIGIKETIMEMFKGTTKEETNSSKELVMVKTHLQLIKPWVTKLLVHQALIPQPQVVTTTEFTNYMKANDAIWKNMQTDMTSLTNSNLELKNMFGQFMKVNTASSSGSGTLPSNKITNPKEDLKGITTRSRIVYKGPVGFYKVILNGDSPLPTRVIEGVVQPLAPTSAEQRLARKNELKARCTLLMALPDKHQLKFNIHKDVKTLMEDIEKWFGGNKETKKVKSSATASPTTQNIAFVSSQNTDNPNESVSVVASAKVFVSTLPNVDTLSDAVIYSFFASQSNSPQLDNDDLMQIDTDYLEKMDLKWQMVMRGYFAREWMSPKGIRRNVLVETQRRNIPMETSMSNALVSQCDGVGSYDWSFQEEEERTNYALMAFTSSSSSSSDNEVVSCSKACTKTFATLQSHYDKLTNDLRKSQFDVLSYKTGLESVEARLLVYQQMETIFEKDIKLLNLDVEIRENALVALRKKFKKAEQDRDELKLKLEKFQTSSKNPSQLLASTNQKKGIMLFRLPTEEHLCPLNLTRPSTPVIEDWVSDSKDESEAEPTQNAPSFVQPPEHVKTPRPSVKPAEHPIPADHLRKDSPKNHAQRGNHQHYARMTHLNTQRHVVPIAVLTRSKLVPISTARPVTTVVPHNNVTRPRLAKTVVTKPHSPPRRNINHRPFPKPSHYP
nr:reverse transcriptase domain-containing protein [Tanacetum cinerariifolium]